MDILALHIEYLLLRHDCVVVPGFGAFINVGHKAETDGNSDLIKPMTREVRFNSALRHDDGMLASSYARRAKVSFAEGRDMVRRATGTLLDTMAQDGEATIGRLGTVIADKESNLSFHPAATPESLSARLGYYPVPMTRCAASVAHKTTEAVKEPAAKPRTRQFDTERNYYIAVNKAFARSAAMVCVVAMVALSLLLPFTRELHEDQASIVPVHAIAKAAKAVNPAAGPAPEIKPQPEVPTAPRTWHLIVATFRTVQEAENFMAANSGDGYELSIVPSQRLCRVSARDASTKEELIPELNSTEFQSRFSQAWIYNSAE